MNKADPFETIRQVFHHLASISAEVEKNNLLLIEILALIKNLPVETVREHYQKWTDARVEKLYQMSCDAAKIEPPSDEETNP